MIEAYVLLLTEVGRSGRVAEKIRKLQGVTKSRAVTGPFDVVALAEVQDFAQLADLVQHGMQTVEGVTRTMTCGHDDHRGGHGGTGDTGLRSGDPALASRGEAATRGRFRPPDGGHRQPT